MKALLQQALDVLRGCLDHPDAADAIAALQSAIAQPEQPAAVQPLTDFHVDLIFQRYCTKADITPELLAFARGIEEAAHNIKEEKD